MVFFFNDTATTEIYTLSLHDALPIFNPKEVGGMVEICAIGSNGAIHLLNSGEMNSKLLPVIEWIGDDGSTWSAALAIASTSSNLLSNGLAVTVDDSHSLFQSGRHLMLGEEDTLCD
mgnify:CR=1 FL=1